MKRYEHKKIEQKWRDIWNKSDIYKTTENKTREKFYILDMFPYPSGAGLHVGHPKGYIATDIISRYKKMSGYNVLHPMGWDAFGLPAEQYALKNKVHPREGTNKNIDTFKKQLEKISLNYDWDREISTTDPEFYHWTQWAFIQMYKKGLVYQSNEPINWCPSCKTGLANEDLENGACERCDTPIEKKKIPQWVIKITDYADRMLEDLDKLDWQEHIKELQRNWIGRSEGAKLTFQVKSQKISNVVLVHGCPSDKELAKDSKTRTYNKHWLPWIKKTLEQKSIKVDFPLMPHPWKPSYEEHKKEFEKLNIDENSILIGTSCGTTFLLRWLGETKQNIKKLILIAPWHEPKLDKKCDTNFYDFEIDETINDRVEDIIIFTSDNDYDIGMKSAKILEEKFDAKVINIKGYGHYMEHQMGTIEFPELLDEILSDFQLSTFNSVEVFTTRPDTLYGATYMVLAPEHELVDSLRDRIENIDEVVEYQKQAQAKTEIERTAEGREKTGVKLEAVMAVNPVNNEEIPIFIADYVLADYGTGAIMAVPAHDERDYAFATRYNESLINAKRTQKDAENKPIEIQQAIAPKMVKTKEQLETIEAYSQNVQKYIDKTPVETYGRHKEWLKEFLLLLKDKNDPIFEIGSGFGRDADYFEKKGFKVIRTDIAKGFVDYQKNKNKDIDLFDVFGDSINENISSVFANATFLHLTKQQLPIALNKINAYIPLQGLVAFSLKKGDGEKVLVDKFDVGRFFSFWTSEEIKDILRKNGYKVIFLDEEDENWILIIAEKVQDLIFTENGILINSGEFDGMDSEEAKEKITEFVGGEMTTTYKLRDWVFSRQRYWGEPIPLVHCEKCGVVPIPEKELPLELPEVESYEPTGTGESPLAAIEAWVNTTCPECGGSAKRETNTMPQWAGSSWYYLRFIDPHNDKALVDKEKDEYWSPVDFYVGGAEHATRHLIYARFWHKFLYDIGVVNYDEPFSKLQTVGLIMAEDGRKMSKRWGNVINPDDVIERFGSDTFRLYEMFMGPFDASIAWSTEGLIGPRKFLEKIWKIYQNDFTNNDTSDVLKKTLNKTIKKVGEDIEEMKYNTAISAMMVLTNQLEKEKSISKEDFENFLKILSPFAPHMTQELWDEMGNKTFIMQEKWPEFDEKYLVDDEITLIVQVNGKVRDKIVVSADIAGDDAKQKALESEKVQKHIDGKEIKKVIFVQGKLISIVV